MNKKIKEREIYLKMDKNKISFLKGILQATDGLAFMRIENSIVRIITTKHRYTETKKLLDSLKNEIDFKYVNKQQ